MKAALAACLRRAHSGQPSHPLPQPSQPVGGVSGKDAPHRILCGSQLQSGIPQGGWRVWEVLN